LRWPPVDCHRGRRIHSGVARVIRTRHGTCREISEFIRSVRCLQHRTASQAAFPIPAGVSRLGADEVRVKPELRHRRPEHRAVVERKQVTVGAVCGVTDGLSLFDIGSFLVMPTIGRAESRCDCPVVVHRRRIVHTSVHDGQCSRRKRWPHSGVSHGLQSCIVPLDDRIIIRCGRLGNHMQNDHGGERRHEGVLPCHGPSQLIQVVPHRSRFEIELGAEVRTSSRVCTKRRLLDITGSPAKGADATGHGQPLAGKFW
jgi:hypothetical protein